MLVHFVRMTGGTIAVNPKFVMFVQDAPNGCDIVMADGGTIRVTESYLTAVGILSGQLN